MKGLRDWRRMCGILLAGLLIAGCVAPIIYKGYKLYQSSTQISVIVNIKEPADKVYASAISAIEKKKINKIVERNDKDMVLSLQSIENKDVEGSAKVNVLTSNSSTLIIEVNKVKGIDPEVQRKSIIDSVTSVCTELGYVCTEEKK